MIASMKSLTILKNSASNPLQEAWSGFQKSTWLTAEFKVFLNFLLVDRRIQIKIGTNDYGSGSSRPTDRRILRIRNIAQREGETSSFFLSLKRQLKNLKPFTCTMYRKNWFNFKGRPLKTFFSWLFFYPIKSHYIEWWWHKISASFSCSVFVEKILTD